MAGIVLLSCCFHFGKKNVFILTPRWHISFHVQQNYCKLLWACIQIPEGSSSVLSSLNSSASLLQCRLYPLIQLKNLPASQYNCRTVVLCPSISRSHYGMTILKETSPQGCHQDPWLGCFSHLWDEGSSHIFKSYCDRKWERNSWVLYVFWDM